jgi:radical SAM protein with 4Fe4S-binding SPASM domain
MNDKFCYMPWHGLAVAANGNIKPCCQWTGSMGKVGDTSLVEAFKAHPAIVNLRKQFLNNEQPKSCQSCWTREEQIGGSRRQWFEKRFMSTVADDYQYTEKVDDIQWTQMDINLSNVCNLKCRMCGSWASNSWFEEDLLLSKINNNELSREQNPERQTIRQHGLDDLKELIPYLKNLQRIDFKGGEPMMAKNHVEFLSLLIENKLNEDLTLQYTTNGTIVNPNILNALSKFKKVRIMFSIEGTGSLYSYIRGGRYTIDEMEETLSLYNGLDNVELGFNVTVQAYNLLNLKDLYNKLYSWADKYHNVSANDAFTTICNAPMYLSPFVLPASLREVAKKELSGISDFNTLVKNLESDQIHIDHWDKFKTFTLELDKLRKDSVLKHVPELEGYLNG